VLPSLFRIVSAAVVALCLLCPSAARAGEPSGFAVLARDGATDAAWSLAKALYARDGLRPLLVDEAHARVLAGEPAPPLLSPAPPERTPQEGTHAKDLADLAETRAAIHGDDAPSRQLLTSIATTFELRGILFVEMVPQSNATPPAAARPRARLFFAKTGFDAAEYLPDEGSSYAPVPVWSGAVRSLDRAYGGALDTPQVAAAANATKALPPPAKAPEGEKRPFYTSPWFWGAIGAAVFAGGAVYLATRDNAPSTIHLQVQVPK
jgi:hypothetical protein